MLHRLPRGMQKGLGKRMGPLGLETITSWKAPELASRRAQPRAFPLRQRQRARRHRLLEAFLRRRHLVPLAVAVAAPAVPLLAEVPRRALHQRPPLLRLTPRLPLP